MISDYKLFKEEVKKGIAGDQPCLPLIYKKLGSRIAITKRMYILFGGMPGTGKTAIVDSMFVLEPYLWWQQNKDKANFKPFWIYRSMERAKFLKIAKWTSYLMWRFHGIIIDTPTLMGWSNKMYDLNSTHLKIIDSLDPFFEEFFKHCLIIDGAENPTGVYKTAVGEAMKRGKVIQVDDWNKRYVPDDDQLMMFHITDHIGKVRKERGFGDKETLDKHSEYMGELRDKFGFICIDIMQMNRNIEDTTRKLKTELDVSPKDFKGTSDTYENFPGYTN